jgi:hypothetical protein
VDDQNCQNILDLSYNGIQIMLGIASEIEAELASVRTGANHYHRMQLSGSTGEDERGIGIVEENEQWSKGRRGTRTGSPASPPLQVHQGQGIHGLYLMGIFLACGLLMTLGWGGITTVLVSVVRAGCGSSVMCDNLSHMSHNPQQQMRGGCDDQYQ